MAQASVIDALLPYSGSKWDALYAHRGHNGVCGWHCMPNCTSGISLRLPGAAPLSGLTLPHASTHTLPHAIGRLCWARRSSYAAA